MKFGNAVIITFGTLIVGCAHMSQSSSEDSGQYRESAYYDGNRPPESMRPQLWKTGDDLSKNQMFIQTQADYHFTVAEAYGNEGKHRKAIESFRTALIYDPQSAMIRMRLAAEYVKIGVLTEALEQAEEAVRLNPELVDARLLLAGLYSSMRMYDSAVAEYKRVLEQEPDNTEAPLFIGAVYAEQKKFDEAIGYFKQLVNNEKYQSKYMAHYYIGRLLAEKGGAEKSAEASFRKSMELSPKFADAVLGLANLYKKRAEDEKATKVLEEWQKKNGPSSAVAEVLAQTYLENEQYEQAYEHLKIVEVFAPQDLNIKVKVALVLIERERYELAVGKLEQVIREVPDSDKIRFYLAAVYEELKQFGKAIENYELIPPVSSFYSEAVVHKAYLHKVQGDTKKAKTALEEGLAKRKDVPQFYTLYASILDELSEHRTAVQILEEGVSRFGNHVQIRFFLGSMYDKTGDLQGTLREMKKVIELDENHVQALNYLAYTYAENRLKLEEAETLARRALELEPEDGYILDTLGWILYKQGRVEEAISVLELAHSKQKTESVIAEHLGDAYNSVQLPEKARRMYRLAAQRATDKKKIREINEKIAVIEQQMGVGDRTPASDL